MDEFKPKNFKAIPGYEGKYLIDREGNIWSTYCHANKFKRRIDRFQKLNPFLNKNGYKTVSLFTNEGKAQKKMVHRLVALTFLDNPENKRCVCHKDNNKLNCNADNLYWGTDAENIQQAYDDGTHNNNKPVAQLNSKGEIVNVFLSESEAARFIGASPSRISDFLTINRKKLTHVKGYRWKKITKAEYNAWQEQEGDKNG